MRSHFIINLFFFLNSTLLLGFSSFFERNFSAKIMKMAQKLPSNNNPPPVLIFLKFFFLNHLLPHLNTDYANHAIAFFVLFYFPLIFSTLIISIFFTKIENFTQLLELYNKFVEMLSAYLLMYFCFSHNFYCFFFILNFINSLFCFSSSNI